MSLHTVRMPDLGEGVVEAEVVTWMVAVGDSVTSETPMVEVLTDKASVEVSAPVAGVIAEIVIDEGAIATVGSDLVRIRLDADDGRATPEAPEPDDEATEPPPPTEPAAPRPSVPDQGGPPPLRPLAAPTVRRLARELGVDLGAITGTGPGGRILREDVEAARDRPSRRTSPRRPDAVEPVRGVRRAIAQHLGHAWEVPHITYVDEVDVTELEELRVALNAELEGDGVRLSPLPFIARAVVLACADQPRLNATYDADAELLHLHGAVHLGVATQTDRGLVVPVVRDADRRSLTDLFEAMRVAAEAARDGSADRSRLSGSTITLTSLGALGGLMNTPILNAPEVAIVGVNKMRTAPVWTGAAFAPRTVLNLSASFDHRIVDGWDAAVFVQRIRELLETPALLTLGWDR